MLINPNRLRTTIAPADCLSMATRLASLQDEGFVRASPPRTLSNANSLLSVDAPLEYSGRLILYHVGRVNTSV